MKTALDALEALRCVAESDRGITAEILGERIGKSSATARYLLNTLCQEGYARRGGTAGRYRLKDHPPWGNAWGALEQDSDASADGGAARAVPLKFQTSSRLGAGNDMPSLVEMPGTVRDAVTELHARTRLRCYLAQWDGESAVIVHARGQRGQARIPGLRERVPLAQAHALAATKVLLASTSQSEQLLLAQSDRPAYTVATMTSTRKLERELARVRRLGIAVDREEFAEGFCCVAAPILGPGDRVTASLAVSLSTAQFVKHSSAIGTAVREIAAVASSEWRERDVRRDSKSSLSEGERQRGGGYRCSRE